MRYLVFSDTHLTHRFDEKKYRFLRSIIEKADHVVINGDLWDGYETYFTDFLNSEWKKLFPLLKKKHAIYLYGNHDAERYCDNRAEIFSDEQKLSYILDIKGKKYVLSHGDTYAPLIDAILPLERFPAFLNHLSDVVQGAVIRYIGIDFFKSMFRSLNAGIKRKIVNDFKAGEVYICGHTHVPEFNLGKQFINTGFIQYGVAHYLEIIDGEPFLRSEKY